MNINDIYKDLSFQATFQDENNKLLVDFFALLLEWEIEDEHKSNVEKDQKI